MAGGGWLAVAAGTEVVVVGVVVEVDRQQLAGSWTPRRPACAVQEGGQHSH